MYGGTKPTTALVSFWIRRKKVAELSMSRAISLGKQGLGFENIIWAIWPDST